MIFSVRCLRLTSTGPSLLHLFPYDFLQFSEKPSVFANPPTISESVNEDTDDTVISAQQVHITPLEVQKHLHQVWQNDEALLNVLLGSYSTPTATKRKSSPQMFLLNVIPVPPARFRPVRSHWNRSMLLLITDSTKHYESL